MYCTSARDSFIIVILRLHYLFIVRTFLLDVFAKTLNLFKLVAQVIGLGLYLISCVLVSNSTIASDLALVYYTQGVFV